MFLGLSLGAIAAMSIVVNFAYQWYVLTTIGPGPATDALFAGTMVPQLVLVIASGSLNYVLIPLLAVQEPEGRTRLAWTYFQGIGLACLGLVALLMLTAAWWVPVTVPGFTAANVDLAIHLTRVQLLATAFTAVTGVEVALHHAKQHFLRAESAGVLASVVGLAFIVWGLPRMGIEAAAWGTVLRAAVQMLLLTAGMGRYRTPHWADPGLALGLRRSAPLIGGQLYFKSDAMFDRFLASLAPPGALSLYHVAQQLYSSAAMVLNRAVVAPVVPRLSRLASGNGWTEFVGEVNRRLVVMLGIALAITAGLALLGRPVLGLIFGRGEFTPDRVAHLWWLLLLLSGVWIGGALGQILSTSFYAQGDTRTPTRVGIIGFTLAIGLKLVAFRGYGIEGLSVAASAYYLLNASALFVLLRRRARRVIATMLPLEGLARP
jgi:putative peptidoglycan lipid II flippase